MTDGQTLTTDMLIQAALPVLRQAQQRSEDGALSRLIYAGPRFVQALHWETQERQRWEGRDWRRLKRERRRFMARAPRDQALQPAISIRGLWPAAKDPT